MGGAVIYLTFDMDWADDTVLEYFYHLLKRWDVPATVFVTHSTELLQKFRDDSKIELGIHPNFNKLLHGDSDAGNYKQVIDAMINLVPEAISYRSHALTDSSLIIQYCAEKGIKYNVNTFFHPQNGMRVVPYKRSGITMLPFFFEDDIWLLERERKPLQYYLSDAFTAPRIFNFHPIHLYLNCETYQRYEEAKTFYHNPEKLHDFRNRKEGMENIFARLVESAKQADMEFRLIKEYG